MLESIVYLMTMTALNNYSTLLTIFTPNAMFDPLYRRPFGPIGYYAFGAMLSIFYFEYSQASS